MAEHAPRLVEENGGPTSGESELRSGHVSAEAGGSPKRGVQLSETEGACRSNRNSKDASPRPRVQLSETESNYRPSNNDRSPRPGGQLSDTEGVRRSSNGKPRASFSAQLLSDLDQPKPERGLPKRPSAGSKRPSAGRDTSRSGSHQPSSNRSSHMEILVPRSSVNEDDVFAMSPSFLDLRKSSGHNGFASISSSVLNLANTTLGTYHRQLIHSTTLRVIVPNTIIL